MKQFIYFLTIGTFMFLAGCSDDSSLGEAIDDMGDSVEEAVEELDPNRTPGEELGDAIEDTGEEIQDAAN